MSRKYLINHGSKCGFPLLFDYQMGSITFVVYAGLAVIFLLSFSSCKAEINLGENCLFLTSVFNEKIVSLGMYFQMLEHYCFERNKYLANHKLRVFISQVKLLLK